MPNGGGVFQKMARPTKADRAAERLEGLLSTLFHLSLAGIRFHVDGSRDHRAFIIIPQQTIAAGFEFKDLPKHHRRELSGDAQTSKGGGGRQSKSVRAARLADDAQADTAAVHDGGDGGDSGMVQTK